MILSYALILSWLILSAGAIVGILVPDLPVEAVEPTAKELECTKCGHLPVDHHTGLCLVRCNCHRYNGTNG